MRVSAATAFAVAVFFGLHIACPARGEDRTNIIFVHAGLETGANDGSSWSNAFQGRLGLQQALAQAGDGPAAIWVAAGTYAPAPAGGDRNASFMTSRARRSSSSANSSAMKHSAGAACT